MSSILNSNANGVSGTIVILYGSQTGTAQDVAEELARDAARRHFQVILSALDDYDVNELLRQSLLVIVASTTGQGDPPDNMNKFWKFIMRKGLPAGALSHVQYAVAGLGDSSYPKFNFVAKKLFKRLQQLGGHALVQVALADDQHELGHYAAIEPWMKELWERALSLHPIPSDKTVLSDNTLLPPRCQISVPQQTSSENGDLADFHKGYENIPLISNERITHPDHWQDVRMIKLDISNSSK